MFRLLLGLVLFMLPCFAQAQFRPPPLDGKLHLLIGNQLNMFATVKTLEGPHPWDKLRSFPGLTFEANYVLLRKLNQEYFVGPRYSIMIYERSAVEDFSEYSFLGYYRHTYSFGFLQSTSVVIGWRCWLEPVKKANFAFEASLLTTYNSFDKYGDFSLINPGNKVDVNTITPTIRIGNILSRNWLLCNFSLAWQPVPIFKRTFDWSVIGGSGNPPQKGSAMSSHGMWQIAFGVGLRL